jgi:hypothetical protein
VPQTCSEEDDEGDALMTQEAFEFHTIRNPLHALTDGEQARQFLRQAGPYSSAPRHGLVLPVRRTRPRRHPSPRQPATRPRCPLMDRTRARRPRPPAHGPPVVDRHHLAPRIRRLPAAAAGHTILTPSGNCPSWPLNGTAPAGATGLTWTGTGNSSTGGSPAPCAKSATSPAGATPNAPPGAQRRRQPRTHALRSAAATGSGKEPAP